MDSLAGTKVVSKLFLVLMLTVGTAGAGGTYPVIDTGQTACYDVSGTVMTCPLAGAVLAGQDAQIAGIQPTYRDNGDGTISDLQTGLMWQKNPGAKVHWWQAMGAASTTTTGGFNDWRVPTIKELYSLMDFDGVTGTTAGSSTPYLDTRVFDFSYGDTSIGERFIDAQYWTSTEYVSTTMWNDATVFGVNFADGRIKGYPKVHPQEGNKHSFVRYVRGNSGYGINDLDNHQDGTVTDHATGLMWSQNDSGVGMDWQDALAWVTLKNAENHLGYDDWRLPNAKEMHSILDYSRSPDTTASAASDRIFQVTEITGGRYPYFWTSTSHRDGPPQIQGSFAVYLCFGEALGYMESPPGSGNLQLLDVHGAGAQRSDPKAGDPADYPSGNGPQGDVVRINNFVRLVRAGFSETPVLFVEGFDSGGFQGWGQ